MSCQKLCRLQASQLTFGYLISCPVKPGKWPGWCLTFFLTWIMWSIFSFKFSSTAGLLAFFFKEHSWAYLLLKHFNSFVSSKIYISFMLNTKANKDIFVHCKQWAVNLGLSPLLLGKSWNRITMSFSQYIINRSFSVSARR